MIVWFIAVIALVVVAYHAGKIRRRYFEQLGRLTMPLRSVRFQSSGRQDQQVVGESHYQPALRAIAGAGEVRHECDALVEMENENPHDPMAVRISIGDATVGYLSRDAARAYRSRMAVYGEITGECGAVIAGGGPDRMLGVWLDLPGDPVP